MASKGTVTVRILGDAKDLQAALGTAGGSVDKFSKKTEDVGKKLRDAGGKMTAFASIPVAAAMGAAAASASNLEQSVGGIESVFGEASASITEFGDTAAQTTGLSERQVNEMAAVIGASLQGLGFDAEDAASQVITLEKRAADMAATFGGDTEEAIQAVSSALRGERDPIERYGVSIKQADVNARILALGLDTSTAAAEKKSTAIATLDLIMGQTAKTEGQFARESEGAAGSMAIARAEMENAAAEIGAHLLPIVADLAGNVADLATRFGGLSDPVQKAILAFAGLVVLAGPLTSLVGGIMKVNTAAGKLADRIPEVNRFSGAFGKLAKAGGAVAAAFVAIQAVDAFAKATADNVPSVEKLTTSLLDLQEAGEATGALAKITGDNFEELGKKIKIAGNSPFSIFDSAGIRETQEANQQIDALDKSLASLFAQDPSQARARFNQLRDAAVEQGVSLETVRDRFNDYSDAVAGAGNEARITAGKTDEVGDAAADAEGPIIDLAAAAEESDRKFRDLSDAIDGVGDALYGAVDAQFAYLESEDRIQDAVADQVAAQKDYNDTVRTFGENSAEAAYSREMLERANRNVAKAQVDSLKAAQDLEAALADEYLTLVGNEQASGAFRDRLIELQRKFPELTGVIQPYIDRLDAIPRNIVTRLSIQQDGVLDFSGSNISARARGGPVSPRTPYLVGEDGPELIIPGAAGSVLPADRTAATLGGGNTYNMPITLNGADVGLAAQIEMLQRSVGWAISNAGR